MKLQHLVSKSTFLDIFCALSDVNDSLILTHTVTLIVSTAALLTWKTGLNGKQYILRSLGHISYQQLRGLIFSKIVFNRGLLVATHKRVQKMKKGSITYAQMYAPLSPEPRCCKFM